jgi:hypothetical protein
MATRRPKYGARADDKRKINIDAGLDRLLSGMGPKRVLLRRRMSMLPRDLQRAVPAETTVTEIARRYGFW